MSRRAKPLARPAPQLGHWGYAVIRAADGISYGAKLVLGLLMELDRPDKDGIGGAYQDPARLAEQLGMGVSVLKDIRAECQRLGLLARESVSGSRLDYWFPRLPPGFEYRPPADASQDNKRAWLQASAVRLARHIASRREAGKPVPERMGNPVSSDTRGRDSRSSQDGKPGLSLSAPSATATVSADATLEENGPSVTLKQFDNTCDTQEYDTRSESADEYHTKGKGVTRKAGNLGHDLDALLVKLATQSPAKATA